MHNELRTAKSSSRKQSLGHSMLTVAFINAKGGVGKTTIACATAYCFGVQSKHVSILDSDPSRSSTRCVERATPKNVTVFHTVVSRHNMPDILIVDTPARPDFKLHIAPLPPVDLCIVPTTHSIEDLILSRQTILSLLEAMPKLKVRLLFNKVEPMSSDRGVMVECAAAANCKLLEPSISYSQTWSGFQMGGFTALSTSIKKNVRELCDNILDATKK